MQAVLIIDLETTGIDAEKDAPIEVGAVLWHIPTRSIVETRSATLRHYDGNPAEHINGISPKLLEPPWSRPALWIEIAGMAAVADAYLAQQADFDRGFCERYADPSLPTHPWICTREDVRWPRCAQPEGLVSTALKHGLGVVGAHRAIYDCLLIARLLEAIPEPEATLAKAIEHAKLPRARIISLASYDDREKVRAHGFRWDADKKQWWRYMAAADAAALPFKTREVSA